MAGPSLPRTRPRTPTTRTEREFIRQEFTARGIVRDPKELAVATDYEHPAVKDLDLAALVSDDGVAYDFADRNRALLHIPVGIPFQVEPRLDVTKLYYHRDGKRRGARVPVQGAVDAGWSRTRSAETGPPNARSASAPPWPSTGRHDGCVLC